MHGPLHDQGLAWYVWFWCKDEIGYWEEWEDKKVYAAALLLFIRVRPTSSGTLLELKRTESGFESAERCWTRKPQTVPLFLSDGECVESLRFQNPNHSAYVFLK
jgi:hypothetical protein